MTRQRKLAPSTSPNTGRRSRTSRRPRRGARSARQTSPSTGQPGEPPWRPVPCETWQFWTMDYGFRTSISNTDNGARFISLLSTLELDQIFNRYTKIDEFPILKNIYPLKMIIYFHFWQFLHFKAPFSFDTLVSRWRKCPIKIIIFKVSTYKYHKVLSISHFLHFTALLLWHFGLKME